MKIRFLFFLLFWSSLVFGQSRLKVSDRVDFSYPQDSIFLALLDTLFLEYDEMELYSYEAIIKYKPKTIKQAKQYYFNTINKITKVYPFYNLVEIGEDMITLYFKEGVITVYRNRREVVISYVDDYGLSLIL